MKKFVTLCLLITITMTGLFIQKVAAEPAVTKAEFEHCMVTAAKDPLGKKKPGNTFRFDHTILSHLQDDCAAVWHRYMQGFSTGPVGQEVSDKLKQARAAGLIPDLRESYVVEASSAHSALSGVLALGNGGIVFTEE